MALGLSVADDIVYTTLTFYVRGKSMYQTVQDKPLLGFLKSGSKTFPGGKDYVSTAVKGTFMSDTAGFLAGYSEDDALSFLQSQAVRRVQYPWREVAANLIISYTELKKDGITITDNQKEQTHSQTELIRLTSMLEERLSDFSESWARAMNSMLWADGTQDAKQVAGVQSIMTATPAAGITGGIDRGTASGGIYWWQHRRLSNIAVSSQNQTLSKVLRHELVQLRRFGGRPNKALCGSTFIDGLMTEIEAKGLYTQEGFSRSSNDIGMDKIRMKGLGDFEYDPTLDSLGLQGSCYIIDSRRLKLRPMEGEDNKIMNPERPYQYMVFLKTMTWTGALECTQLNALGVYDVGNFNAF